mmetsp:Transcript_1518/g.3237  ORF Transcript_1518/g.3237 Transcript_1518/m.3237 type:complete len:146 (-) Transcript_1518:209-646(-)|eukprot:CAMPEP_0170233108 /NCGR_PEP_ID=MMETSP0116_2-20130129/16299_1 /TAXON_ID=400756 /ORGANISM="Durinskia baltica, Strain CSIRO CS-38" /LENGTH=145 /DNA_ID=CAMNT_0010483901 /DNA_START=88 /DNA_END=525 /DNA_ORIENTATION=+
MACCCAPPPGPDAEVVDTAPAPAPAPVKAVEQKAEPPPQPPKQEEKPKLVEVKKEPPAKAGLTLTFAVRGADDVDCILEKKPLGMKMKTDSKPAVVTTVEKGGAAEAAGVKVGMQLKAVAGANVEDKAFGDVIALLKKEMEPLPS